MTELHTSPSGHDLAPTQSMVAVSLVEAGKRSTVKIEDAAQLAVEAITLDGTDKKHVDEAKKAASKARKKEHRTIDATINQATITVISNFSMALGIVGFIALTLCVISITSTVDVAYIPYVRNGATSVQDALKANYGTLTSWSAFDQACCCENSTGSTYAQQVEFWRCETGINLSNSTGTLAWQKAGGVSFLKERLRKGKVYSGDYSPDDGTSLRPFCSHNFTGGRSPTSNNNYFGGWYISVAQADDQTCTSGQQDCGSKLREAFYYW